MSDTLDSLEARAPEQRERELMAALPELIARAQGAPGWARILAGVDAAAIDSRAALAQLPVTRKSDLKLLQQGALPFGGLTTTSTNALSRVFVSPGPIFDPEGKGADWWRFARPCTLQACAPAACCRTAFPIISRRPPLWSKAARRASAAP